jgi:hypothetical protein
MYSAQFKSLPFSLYLSKALFQNMLENNGDKNSLSTENAE